MPRVKIQFSQLELKVGPTMTHGMMSNSKRMDIRGILEFVKLKKTKEPIVLSSQI